MRDQQLRDNVMAPMDDILSVRNTLNDFLKTGRTDYHLLVNAIDQLDLTRKSLGIINEILLEHVADLVSDNRKLRKKLRKIKEVIE